MNKNKKDIIIRKIKYLQTFIFPLFIVIIGILASIVAFYGLFYVVTSVISKQGFWN